MDTNTIQVSTLDDSTYNYINIPYVDSFVEPPKPVQRNMSQNELDILLKRHQEWLRRGDDPSIGERLVLQNATLRHCRIEDIDLSKAVFNSVIFDDCAIAGCVYKNAVFNNVILKDTFMIDCTFIKSDFRFFKYYNDDDHTKYLTGMRECLFYNVRFHCCNFQAPARNCIFTAIDSNLYSKYDGLHVPMACPETGSFIAYKKGYGDCIIQLEIPEDAKRCSAFGRKCRCDKAKVLAIYDQDRNPIRNVIASSRRSSRKTGSPLAYKVGEMVYPDDFDDNRWNECTNGIHFFMTFQEAVDY